MCVDICMQVACVVPAVSVRWDSLAAHCSRLRADTASMLTLFRARTAVLVWCLVDIVWGPSRYCVPARGALDDVMLAHTGRCL